MIILDLLGDDLLEVLHLSVLPLHEGGDQLAPGHAAVAGHGVLLSLGVQQGEGQAVLPPVGAALRHAQLPADYLVLLQLSLAQVLHDDQHCLLPVSLRISGPSLELNWFEWKI